MSYAYQVYTKTGAIRYLNESGNLTSKLASARKFTGTVRDGPTARIPGQFIDYPSWDFMPTTVSQIRALCPGFFTYKALGKDKKSWCVIVGTQSYLLIHRVGKDSRNLDIHAYPVYRWNPEDNDLRFEAELSDDENAKEWRRSGLTPKQFLASKAVPV